MDFGLQLEKPVLCNMAKERKASANVKWHRTCVPKKTKALLSQKFGCQKNGIIESWILIHQNVYKAGAMVWYIWRRVREEKEPLAIGWELKTGLKYIHSDCLILLKQLLLNSHLIILIWSNIIRFYSIRFQAAGSHTIWFPRLGRLGKVESGWGEEKPVSCTHTACLLVLPLKQFSASGHNQRTQHQHQHQHQKH